MNAKVKAGAAKETKVAEETTASVTDATLNPKPNEVAEKGANTGGALAVPTMDFYEDAGKGMEGGDKDSFAIPFLAILQGLSPQMETVEGAKIGLLINTITNALAKEVLVVPVGFKRRYLRWTPRDEGGGFKGEMQVSEVDALVAAGKAKKDEDTGGLMYEGDHLKDTRIHFVLVLKPDGGWDPAIISMAGTQVKRSKRWFSLMNGIQLKAPNGAMFNPPSFSHVYKITTTKEENAKGAWYSFVPTLHAKVEDPYIYVAAKEFHAQIASDKVVYQPPAQDDEPAAETGEGKF